jgi:hypothetical protein
MRKFVTALVAAAFLAAPVTQSQAFDFWWWCQPKPKHTVATHSNNLGPWAIACGASSVASLMIGTGINASNGRQLTITEATWYASACPFLLPFALVATATCPDSKATYEVARLAFRYIAKHPGADQSAFTNAYGEACHGQLSRATLRSLRALI